MKNARVLKSYGLCLFFLFLATLSTRAENWPGWRGPRGDGSSLDANVPTEWDGETGHHILWKVALPGVGHASPIVWNEHVFLVSCLEESTERILLCLDRSDGKTRWQRTVLNAPLETIHALNSRATSTPTTDGRRIYVAFLEVDGTTIPAPNVGTPRLITPGQMVVAAYDFAGNQQWSVKPGPFISAHGFCSCPVVFEDLVIVNGDHDGESFLIALDSATGNVVWRVEREHKTRSYVTPIIRQVAGRTQMVMSGNKSIVSYDPRTGTQHWNIHGPTEQFVASMVFDGKLFFMTCGYPDYHVMGIRPDGQGDVSETHIAWRSTAAHAYVPSPVVVDNYLLVADDRGTANCFDAATGKRLWNARLAGGFSTSAVHAAGLAYFVADDGTTKIVRPGPQFEVVAENRLGEAVHASPAISDGQLFLRGEKHLYCIGSK